MKTLNQNTRKPVYMLLCALVLSTFAQAQSHVTMGMRNITANKNTIEYDLYILNDGTTDLKLSACSYGVNFNQHILNNGAATYHYKAKSRTQELNGLSEIAREIARADGIQQARMTSVPSRYENAPVLPKGKSYVVGHFVLQNSGDWTPNSRPEFSFQETLKIGLTTTQVVVYEDNSRKLVALTPSLKSVSTVIEEAPVLNPLQTQLAAHASATSQDASKAQIKVAQEVKLYPNPVPDMLHIGFDITAVSHLVVNIYDFQGRLVRQIHTDVVEGYNDLNMDVSDLVAGIYTLRLSDRADFNYTQSFTKQ